MPGNSTDFPVASSENNMEEKDINSSSVIPQRKDVF